MSSARLTYPLVLPLLCLLASCQGNRDGKPDDGDISHPWILHALDAAPPSGSDGVKLADVNGDGYPDLATGFEEGGVSRIYLNPGHGSASKEHWPYVELPSPHVEDALLVDLDQNGIVDLVTACEGKTNQIFFHWAPDDPDDYLDATKWTTQAVPAVSGLSAWMFAVSADMDHENGRDLIVGSKRKSGDTGEDKAFVGWLKCPENPRDVAGWTFHPLTKAGWIMSIVVYDMNRDGRPDVVISDRKNSSQTGVRWLENPGAVDPEFYGEWTSHPVGVDLKEPMFLTIGDLDGDGLDDVVVPDLYEGLVFLKQHEGLIWTQNTVKYPAWAGPRGKSAAIADLDGDGQPDIALSFEEEGKLAQLPYEAYARNGAYSVIGATHQGDPFSEGWSFFKISDLRGRKFDLVNILDMDGDGDLDVLTNDENEEDVGLGVIWYENPWKKPSF